MRIRLAIPGSTAVDYTMAIIMQSHYDRAEIQNIVKSLKRNCQNVSILIAGSNLSDNTPARPEDQIYFMKTDAGVKPPNLHDVIKHALKVAPNSARFFIFNTPEQVGFSEKDAMKIIKEGLDYHKSDSGALFMSKKYVEYIIETGDVPSSTNAVRNGFSSEMSVQDMIRSPREAVRQYSTLVSFALVGASGICVNLLVLTIFKALVGALIANAIAQEVSIASNFAWNDRFTFRNRSKASKFIALPKFYRFIKYNLVSLLSFAVNETVFYLTFSHGIFYIYSSLIAIATAFVVNYVGSSRWAWTKTALQLAKD